MTAQKSVSEEQGAGPREDQATATLGAGSGPAVSPGQGSTRRLPSRVQIESGRPISPALMKLHHPKKTREKEEANRETPDWDADTASDVMVAKQKANRAWTGPV